MPDPERLSAFLDGELDADEAVVVEAEIAADPGAAALLARLRATKRAVAADPAPALTETEAERLDAAVIGALEGAAPLAPPRERLPGSLRRGRSALPYFAVAASLALVLSVGIALFATSLRPDGEGRRTAGLSGTKTGRERDAVLEAPPEAKSATPGTDTDVPSGAQARVAAPEPVLYVTAENLSTDGDLERILAATPTASTSRADTTARLLAMATGLGDYPDLESCLAAAPADVVPMRVDVGLWKGKDAYFVSGGPQGSPPDRVAVLGRHRCSALHLYTPG